VRTLRGRRLKLPLLVAVVALTTLLIGGAGAGEPTTAAASATESPASATEYVALLQDALDALDVQPADTVRARAPIAALLSGPLTAAGYAPRIALQPILDDLDATPPDLADAAGRIHTVITALRATTTPAVAVDHQVARDTLKKVYASSAFADLDTPPQPSWIAQVGDAIRRFFDRFQSNPATPTDTTGGAAGLGIGTITVVLALVVLIAGVVAWLLRDRIRQTGMVEPAGTTGDPDTEWDAALEAARLGDHRAAIRRAFRSSLLSVARHGRLPVDPAWTTRELLARAEGDADLLASLVPAADAFQIAWYSGRPVSEADWIVARARCETVRALAAQTVAGVR
jgi:hypothetical protein